MSMDVDQNLQKDTLDRRQLLSAGMISGVGLLLAACQTPVVRQTTGLPSPVWPDQDPARLPPVRSEPVPRVVTQQPSPQVVHEPAPEGVIPRAEWTRARPIASVAEPMNGVQRITVHHTAINSVGLTTRGEVAKQLESIRRGHVNRGSNWADIGYHFVIDPAGRVWEGRPVAMQGAHVKDHNEHNLGIVMMGNFDEQRPTVESSQTLDRFVVAMMRRFRVPYSRVYTHQELMSSGCPGRNLQRYMLAARSGRGAIRLALG